MRMVCIYTKQHLASIEVSKRCVESAKKFEYNVELYPAIYWRDMNEIHKEYNLIQKYTPIPKTDTTTSTTCPAARMANGTTHFLLYKWCFDNNQSLCIVEHDAIFINRIPEPINDGIIQISSHAKIQMNEEKLYHCTRARKMRKYQPTFEYKWDNNEGMIRHPLTGTNGTSGYIIHPGAAKKMIDYIMHDGIAYADRIRTEHVGEGNLYLQVPQSVLCYHDVKSAMLE